MATNKRNKDCITFHLSYWYQRVQEFLPPSMRYASLAFRTLSLLDLMSSSWISVMSLAEWSLVIKCSETLVSLEILHGLSTCLRCSSTTKWDDDADRKWNFSARTFWTCVRLSKRRPAFVQRSSTTKFREVCRCRENVRNIKIYFSCVNHSFSTLSFSTSRNIFILDKQNPTVKHFVDFFAS